MCVWCVCDVCVMCVWMCVCVCVCVCCYFSKFSSRLVWKNMITNSDYTFNRAVTYTSAWLRTAARAVRADRESNIAIIAAVDMSDRSEDINSLGRVNEHAKAKKGKQKTPLLYKQTYPFFVCLSSESYYPPLTPFLSGVFFLITCINALIPNAYEHNMDAC